jgi:hypothetical protein
MSSNQVLQWALWHHDHGYCPVPTIAGSKGACIPWKPWQTARPTQADIHAWFPDGITRNLALITGAFHGLVIVDCDDEEATRYARLQFAPSPYRVRTRRGMHMYYRHPGPGVHVQTKAQVIKGLNLDVRGDGGQCTGLGSVHASGFVYRLDDGSDLCSPANLPLWDPSWLPYVAPLQPPSLYRGSADLTALARAERYLATCEGSGEGGRNHNTFRVAASVVRDFGLSLEQGWALMSAWNTWKNDPPLAEDELKIIVQSCLSSGRRELGSRLQERREPWQHRS